MEGRTNHTSIVRKGALVLICFQFSVIGSTETTEPTETGTRLFLFHGDATRPRVYTTLTPDTPRPIHGFLPNGFWGSWEPGKE